MLINTDAKTNKAFQASLTTGIAMTREELLASLLKENSEGPSSHTTPSYKAAQSQRWNPTGSSAITGKTIKLHLQQTTFHSPSVLNTQLCSTARGKGMAFRVVETSISTMPRV